MPLTLLIPLSWRWAARGWRWPVRAVAAWRCRWSAVGGWLAFGRVHGRPAHAVLPALAGFWWRGCDTATAGIRPVPLISDDGAAGGVPPALAGLDLYEAGRHLAGAGPAGPDGGRPRPWRRDGDGDRSACNGDGQFALLDDDEQDVPPRGWGRRWAGSPGNAPTWCGSKWHDWAAPVPLQDQIGGWSGAGPTRPTRRRARRTWRMMHVVAPKVTEHEVLVTVTVAVPAQAPATAATAGRWRRRSPRCRDELRLFGPAWTAPGCR